MSLSLSVRLAVRLTACVSLARSLAPFSLSFSLPLSLHPALSISLSFFLSLSLCPLRNKDRGLSLIVQKDLDAHELENVRMKLQTRTKIYLCMLRVMRQSVMDTPHMRLLRHDRSMHEVFSTWWPSHSGKLEKFLYTSLLLWSLYSWVVPITCSMPGP